MVFKIKNIIAFNFSACCLFQDSFIYNNSHIYIYIYIYIYICFAARNLKWLSYKCLSQSSAVMATSSTLCHSSLLWFTFGFDSNNEIK